MKVLIVLACLASFAYAGIKPDTFAKHMKIVDGCIEKNGANKGEMFALLLEKKPIEDRAMKCTMDCVLEQTKILKDNKIDWDKAKEKTREMLDDKTSIKKALEIADTCRNKVNLDGKGECEIGSSLLPCLMEEALKTGFGISTGIPAPQ